MKRLLVFLGGEELAWLRFDDDRIVGRGPSTPIAETDDEVVAVAPGEAVTLHWVEMPELAPAQAAAAGRLAAAEVCAMPIAAAHIAIGPRDEEGYYPLAVVDSAAMAGWLARCREAGLDPDVIAPAPLLMPPPSGEIVQVAEAGGLLLVRGPRVAFAAEPELSALLIGEASPEQVDSETFEAGLAAALEALPLNLRQGGFAKTKPWQLDTRRLKRMAALAVASLAVMLLAELVQIFRYDIAADVAELEVAAEARRVLPRETEIYDAVAQVRARVAESGGAGGFSPTAAALFGALRDLPGAELTSLRYDGAGGLTAAVATGQGGDLAALQERLRLAGYDATVGTPRSEMERAVIDVTVRAR